MMPSGGYAAGSLIVLWSVETCVRWGDAGSEQCRIDYVLPKSRGKTGRLICRLKGIAWVGQGRARAASWQAAGLKGCLPERPNLFISSVIAAAFLDGGKGPIYQVF